MPPSVAAIRPGLSRTAPVNAPLSRGRTVRSPAAAARGSGRRRWRTASRPARSRRGWPGPARPCRCRSRRGSGPSRRWRRPAGPARPPAASAGLALSRSTAGVGVAQRALQPRHPLLQGPHLRDALDDQPDLRGRERLGQVVRRPALHRLHGRVDRGVGGDDDDLQPGLCGQQPGDQVEPRLGAEPQVDERQVERLPRRLGQPRRAALATAVTRWPSVVRLIDSILRMFGSSSTTSTFSPCGPENGGAATARRVQQVRRCDPWGGPILPRRPRRRPNRGPPAPDPDSPSCSAADARPRRPGARLAKLPLDRRSRRSSFFAPLPSRMDREDPQFGPLPEYRERGQTAVNCGWLHRRALVC